MSTDVRRMLHNFRRNSMNSRSNCLVSSMLLVM